MAKSDKLFRYFVFRFKSFSSRMFFIFLICFTVFPLVVLASYSNYQVLETTYNYFYAIAAVLLVSAFIFPIGLFNFTNSKSIGDFYFSLAIKRQDLFIHTYFIGLLVTLLPVTAAVAIGLGTLQLAGSLHFWANLLMYGKILLFYLTIYNLVTLVIQKCNNRFDSFLASILLINLPLSLYYAIVVFLENSLLGFPLYDNFHLIAFISPVFSMFNTWITKVPLYIYLIYIFSLLVVPIIASILFYNRKPEKSADASTSRLIYPLISYGLTFNVFLLTFLVTNDYRFRLFFRYLFSTFCALLIFLAIRMLATRSFKDLFKSLKSFFIYIPLIIITLLAVQWTGGFGYETFVPEPETVLYVEVRKSFLIQLFKDQLSDNSYLTIENQSVINEFTKLQAVLIQYKPSIRSKDLVLNFNYQRAVFNYKRRYGVPFSFVPYSFYYEIIDNKIYYPAYQQFIDYQNNGQWLLLSISDSLNSGGIKIVGSADESQALIKALVADLKDLDIANIYQNSELPLCYLNLYSKTLDNNFEVPIFSGFNRSLDLLATYEYQIPELNLALIQNISLSQPIYHSPYFNNQKFETERSSSEELAQEYWEEYLQHISPLSLSEDSYYILEITLVDNSSQLYAYTK